MKISSFLTSFIDYPNHITLCIFTTGCIHNCTGCHNPELQDPNVGTIYSVEQVLEQYFKRDMCDAIVFSGGDPLFQKDELIQWVKILSKHALIGIYTGYELDQVPPEMLQYINFLKTGPYIEKLGPLSSPTTNQKCFDVVGGVPTVNTSYFKQ